VTTLIIKTNVAQGTDFLIPDLGYFIPSGGGSVILTELTELANAQESSDLRAALTDDAFGVNSSTLIINDGTNDIPQGNATAFLDTLIGGSGTPNLVNRAARDSTTSDLIYIGRSENNPVNTLAAEWQIYRYDSEALAFAPIFADGDSGFVHIWDNRESLTY